MGAPGEIPATIEWAGDRIRLVDQRRLPERLEIVECRSVDDLCDAITTLAIRGAPALGAAGAMGVALAVVTGADPEDAGRRLVATRPTAVNLSWGVHRALGAADAAAEAERVAEEDVERNRRIGSHGVSLVPDGGRALTHCHTGSLACVGYGTALGVLRAAHESGRSVSVWVGETRPALQGARITAWELQRLDIPCTLVTDGMAGSLMAGGEIDLVIVGADRIAANGDVANKIGTYSLAVLASHHGVPFYVAAPRSTFDSDCPDGSTIAVEQRPPEEVTVVGDLRIAPEGVAVENRAFDVTPASLVTAYVTEDGILDARR